MKKIVLGFIVSVFAAAAKAQSGPAAPDLGPTAMVSTSAAKKIDLLGSWTVRVNSHENKSIKMVFTKDGKFRFFCSGAKSEGTYKVHDGVITITYLKVDGEAVEFDMKKNLPFADDGESFEVDTYHYERASTQPKA